LYKLCRQINIPLISAVCSDRLKGSVTVGQNPLGQHRANEGLFAQCL